MEIIDVNDREYKKLGFKGLRLRVKFRQQATNDMESWMKACFDQLLHLISVKLKIQPQDRVGFNFQNIENDKISFNISFRRFDQYTCDVILSALEIVLQSNTHFFSDDNLIINIDHVRIPVGNGRRSFIGKSSEDFYKIHKNALFSPRIREEDGNICLLAAVVVGKAYADGAVGMNLYNLLTYEPNHNELIDHANALAVSVGIDYTNGCGIDEIKKIQEYLGDYYNLNIYTSRDGRSIYYKSPYTNTKHINLLLDNGHYIMIKSLTAVFACAYFCVYCAEPYTAQLQHKKCPFKCDRCFSTPPCVKAIDIHCSGCNRIFLNSLCFNNHLKKKICMKVRICVSCFKSYSYDKKKPHVCGSSFCNLCKQDRPTRHECFIPIIQPKKHNTMNEMFVFFDLECTQTKEFSNDNTKFEHEPNLCISQQVCGACEGSYDLHNPCFNCGVRERIFMKNDVICNFMHYLGSLPEKFKSIKVIAHNLQKYDGHFILRYMYAHASEWRLKTESLIMNGSKILQIKVGRYKFIDSLNFFSVPLSKLPTMFNLNCSSKGYYPHFFNTYENFDYRGAIPDKSFYGVNSMKSDDRFKFLKWYDGEKAKNKVFDNRNELVKYCQQDVNILRLACLKFQNLLIGLTTVDPFDQITIAGTCMAIFKTNFLKKDQIAIIPANGYRMRDNQSYKALKWLAWMSYVNDIKIITAIHGREVRLANDIIVDGYHNGTVFEFLGCYWHQCPKCFPFKHHNAPNNYRANPVRTLYETHLLRSEKIKRLGYKLVCIWEHEFDEMVRTNEQISNYLNTLTYLKNEPLNPRKAFFGGRTGVCKMHHKVNNNEKIYYYDVTSLYPYVNKYCSYPIGRKC